MLFFVLISFNVLMSFATNALLTDPLILHDRSSLDGKCGLNNGICTNGLCCSQWGYCGDSDEYCTVGCQPSFGSCKTNDSLRLATATTYSAHDSHTSDSFLQNPTRSVSHYYANASSASFTVTSTYGSVFNPSHTASASVTAATSSSYKLYTGDGTAADGWPAQSKWVDFESMWSANKKLISISCTQFGQPNNSDQESEDVKSAIQAIGSGSGVDPRYILAIMMQESKGCVRAPTTNYGVRNPGLMQSHDGSGTCNDGHSQNPCSTSCIYQMISDGAAGTKAGDGLKQTIAQAKCSDDSKFYKGARIYNSGSISPDGDLGRGFSTHCYSSDIANRLTGWVDAVNTCNL